MEHRRLRSTTRLTGYLDWPGVQQVCVRERTRRIGAETTTETAFAITSLPPEAAGAADLAGAGPGPLGGGEPAAPCAGRVARGGRLRVKTGSAPEVLAGLRNAALGVLRPAGVETVAAHLRRCAAHPLEAVRLVFRAAPD